MLIKNSEDIKSSEITSESAYLNRRELISGLAKLGLVGTTLLSSQSQAGLFDRLFGEKKEKKILKPLTFKQTGLYDTNEAATAEAVTSSYNNFYEFSLDKEDPARLATNFNSESWNLEIAGEAEKTGVFNLEDIFKMVDFEERVYRMRCVEAWSIVVPWVGFSLASLIKQFKPTSKAKYVEFTTLKDSRQFPGQRRSTFGFSSLDWPYVEGLRMDEAMNPLTLMTVGMYGKELPAQNGAPLRLIVPWKYGFKGIKSIVKIRFTEEAPVNSWQNAAPREYGFYANVNPEVSHPRWSQANERRLTNASLTGIQRIATQPFNGYGEQVAHLYKGMDLERFF